MGWEYKFTNEIPQGKVGSILYFFLKQKRIKDLERVTGYNSLRAHFETTEDSTTSRIAAYVSMDIFSLWNPLFLLSVVIEKGGKEHTKPWKKTASPTPPPQTSKYFKKKKNKKRKGFYMELFNNIKKICTPNIRFMHIHQELHFFSGNVTSQMWFLPFNQTSNLCHTVNHIETLLITHLIFSSQNPFKKQRRFYSSKQRGNYCPTIIWHGTRKWRWILCIN